MILTTQAPPCIPGRPVSGGTYRTGGILSAYIRIRILGGQQQGMPIPSSYTYDLGPSMRLLMLDTCQYEPRNKVGGMIKTRDL